MQILTDYFTHQAERNKKQNDKEYNIIKEELVKEDLEVGSDDTAYLWACKFILNLRSRIIFVTGKFLD